MFYHVKIACYQGACQLHVRERLGDALLDVAKQPIDNGWVELWPRGIRIVVKQWRVVHEMMKETLWHKKYLQTRILGCNIVALDMVDMPSKLCHDQKMRSESQQTVSKRITRVSAGVSEMGGDEVLAPRAIEGGEDIESPYDAIDCWRRLDDMLGWQMYMWKDVSFGQKHKKEWSVGTKRSDRRGLLSWQAGRHYR